MSGGHWMTLTVRLEEGQDPEVALAILRAAVTRLEFVHLDFVTADLMSGDLP